MAGTEPLVIAAKLDTSDLVAQLRAMARAFADAADALERLDRHAFQADPIAGTVIPGAEDGT